MTADEIRKGIAPYRHEQRVLLRLLRMRGGFTEKEFDRWFRGREFRKRRMLLRGGLSGDALILGMGANGFSLWAEMLDLLQHMMLIDLVDAKTVDGVVVYRLGAAELER